MIPGNTTGEIESDPRIPLHPWEGSHTRTDAFLITPSLGAMTPPLWLHEPIDQGNAASTQSGTLTDPLNEFDFDSFMLPIDSAIPEGTFHTDFGSDQSGMAHMAETLPRVENATGNEEWTMMTSAEVPEGSSDTPEGN